MLLTDKFRRALAWAFVAWACALAAACVFGCRNGQDGQDAQTDSGQAVSAEARTSTVNYVCVGMETSMRFGSCPGCRLDSCRMDAFLRGKFGYSGVLLQSERATRQAVSNAMRDGIARTGEDGLFILYYSGHGGQESLPSAMGTSEPEGADSPDEYLCLYDSYLLDDEIWKIVSTCRGRVFLMFDACHSQTMYRSVVADVALERGLAVPLEATPRASALVRSSGGFRLPARAVPLDGAFRMLCWSGCLEKEYSFGSSAGGVLTNALLRRWKAGIGYEALWALACEDVLREQPTQHPQATRFGSGFSEAFR